tara:strand:+ start:74 stop:820 length:747 start_codon:yes stop_codon:yes gene_type:complete
MADRIPLIVNTGDSQIQELASTDNLALASKLLVTNSTDSTSKDTGSTIIDGGVGIEKNLHVGGTGTFTGNVTAPVFMGSANAVSLTNDTGSSYRQLIFTSATAGGLNAPLLIDNGSSGAGIQFRPSDNTLRVDGDIIAFHTSDKRVKKNLKRIKDPIKKIMGLNGYTFTWKETAVPEIGYEGVKPKHEDTGIVAQEVEELGLPDVINIRDSGIMAVRYTKLIPLLIEAVKELSTELDALKKDYQNHNH